MIQQQFMNNQLNIICCTAAFGMGINKKDIRLIIHYHLPLQIESFIQEIGRAGRDGEESVSILYYSESDIHLPLNIIENQFLLQNDLQNAITKLSKMDKILKNETEMENYLLINEIQWENLKYQLENHDMIREDVLSKNKHKWVNFIQTMIEQNESQKMLKQNDLYRLVEWIKTDKCLRVELYKNYQIILKKPLTYCCSSCDFEISKWTTDNYPLKDVSDETWLDKLANVLQVGEYYETS